jgi:SufS family cysteine desulfurase
MSIPKPDLSEVLESPDTALLARLANELFSGLQQGGQAPGIPSATPGNGLAGSYPAESHPFAPPVHPAAHTVSGNGTRSGAHCPGAVDSYPFGEPRCRAIPAEIQATPAAQEASGPLAGASSFYFIREAESVTPPPVAGFTPHSTPTPLRFDVESVRRDFPALHQKINGRPLIWLDNAATTHKPQSVIDATSSFYGRDNSNIHRAAHTLAARSTDLFEGGREKVRQFIGAADTKEIVFVRGTTEAINLVAQTFGRQQIGAGDEILLTTMEHHANIVPWQLLAEQTGAVIRVAPINDRGELILEQFAALLSSRTKLVSVTQVANALGTINPVSEIISLAHGYGVPVLVDGAQSAPHMPVNVQALNADFFTLSGHKIFGPTGIGVLYGKAALLEEMPPWQGGGNMIRDVTFARTSYHGIPAKFEAGTPDIAGVVGLGAAVDYLMNLGVPGIAAYEHELLEYATAALAAVPGLRPIGTAAAKASVLSFVIDGIPSEEIGKHLDKHGIAVRSGHHCAQPSLRRFGLESTVRPSLAFYNTHAEIDSLVQALLALPRK